MTPVGPMSDLDRAMEIIKESMVVCVGMVDAIDMIHRLGQPTPELLQPFEEYARRAVKLMKERCE